MKVLVLGCGEMGRIAVSDLYLHGGFSQIVVGVRSPERARSQISWSSLSQERLQFREIDLATEPRLAQLFSEFNVIVNTAGPNFKYETRIARAAIEAGVHLIDLNDDYETTLEMYDLDAAARDAGIAIIMGLGASPGVNNVLVRAAANEMDEVEEIHTAWVMSAADPGGLALCQHLLYSLSGRALTFADGRMVEVRSFVDGKQRVEFPPPVGTMDIYHIGHPEPITLSRAFPSAKFVDDKATFNPPHINELIVELGAMARESTSQIETPDGPVDAMEYAAAELLKACREVKSVAREGALRVEVAGKANGRGLRIIYNGSGRITYGTGIPASIGARMLREGAITKTGVLAPEECIDPDDFFEEILSRGIGDLEEERIAC